MRRWRRGERPERRLDTQTVIDNAQVQTRQSSFPIEYCFVAPLVGKQPPDSHVWILDEEAPAFVRSQAATFMGGPVWQMDLVSPVWPRGR